MAGAWSSAWKPATRKRRSAKARTSASSSTSPSSPPAWRRSRRSRRHGGTDDRLLSSVNLPALRDRRQTAIVCPTVGTLPRLTLRPPQHDRWILSSHHPHYRKVRLMLLEVIRIGERGLIRPRVYVILPGGSQVCFKRSVRVAHGSARVARRRQEVDHLTGDRLSGRVHNLPADGDGLPQGDLHRSHRLAVHVETLLQDLLLAETRRRRPQGKLLHGHARSSPRKGRGEHLHVVMARQQSFQHEGSVLFGVRRDA